MNPAASQPAAVEPQIDLPFAAPPGDAALAGNVTLLLGLLSCEGWLSAAEISRRILVQLGQRWNDRYVRRLAAASDGQIASGQRGYKLTRALTKAEYDHARNWMLSQVKQMQLRVLQIDQVFNARKPVS